MQLRDAIDRRHGFDQVLQAEFSRIEALPTLETHGSDATLRAAVTEQLRSVAGVRGIYVLGSGHRALAATLSDLGLTGRLVIIGHELTPFTRRALRRGIWIRSSHRIRGIWRGLFLRVCAPKPTVCR